MKQFSRLSAQEKIKVLQELETSKWLDTPYLSQIDSESLQTLLQRKPEGFITLITGKYEYARQLALHKSIITSVLAKKPSYIEYIPMEYMSERLIQVAQSAIDALSSETEKNIVQPIVDRAKEMLHAHLHATTQDYNELKDMSMNTNDTYTTPQPTDSDQDNMNQSVEVLEEPEKESDQEEILDASSKDNSNEQKTPQPIDESKETVKEVMSPKDTKSLSQSEDNIISTGSVVTSSSVTTTIQEVMDQAYLEKLQKELEKMISIHVERLEEHLLHTVDTQIQHIETNLLAERQTLQILQDTLSSPTQALLKGFEEEIHHTHTLLQEANTALLDQVNTTKSITEQYVTAIDQPTHQFLEQVESKIQREYSEHFKRHSEHVEHELNQIKEAVKTTAQNAIKAMETEHRNHEQVLSNNTNFFEKKALLQNITFITVFANLFFFLLIFIMLLK